MAEKMKDEDRPGDSDVYIRRNTLALYVPFGDDGRRDSQRRASLTLQRTDSTKRWWKFTLRDWDDDDEQDWWFVSTAIPLIAAALGPLANALSIAALVTYWRMCLVPGVEHGYPAASCAWNGNPVLGPDLGGVTYKDPLWCYWLNIVSLIAGFIGNFFLLCNFTNRIRYIIALPVTILMWFFATAVLIGITVAMEIYVPPMRPQQTYSQGFWYAVIASVLYLMCSGLLMVNMLGYFLGHYPQNFTLTESQRTLIVQTMLFFVWLGAGAIVFSAVERRWGTAGQRWDYTNALYFCDVTILTIGFGDMYTSSTVGRGLVFPYAVGGIIMLGLMVSSISRFVGELGSENIIRRHIERSRARTMSRTVNSSMELKERPSISPGERPEISGPISPVGRSTTINIMEDKAAAKSSANAGASSAFAPLKRAATLINRKPKLILLREEKDRFEAMRRIQRGTVKFKRYYALCMSATAFGILWGVGAVVFWACERNDQGMTYFEALYFCYVSLLTIGYGDMAPKSNPGRPFFVVWSLFAVPTMTILVSHLGDTVIDSFQEGTFKIADFTILPKFGVWREFLNRHPWLLNWLQQRDEKKAARQRLEEGFPTGPVEETSAPTIDQLAKEKLSHYELARRLAKAIKRAAKDAKADKHHRYTYEEWVEFTQLIRFTAKNDADVEVEEEEGLVEWDWIGEESPMLAPGSEADFVLDRLCESMNRYIRRLASAPNIPDAPPDLQRPVESGRPVRFFTDRSRDDEASEGGSGDKAVERGFDPEDSGSVTINDMKRHATYEDMD